MGGQSIGCFRLFVPPTIPYVIELGSVRSIEPGVGSLIASYAENLAKEKQKQIVAITGNNYKTTIKKHDWRIATRWFPERMQESDDDKELWIYQNL